jgi:hypothetical protein
LTFENFIYCINSLICSQSNQDMIQHRCTPPEDFFCHTSLRLRNWQFQFGTTDRLNILWTLMVHQSHRYNCQDLKWKFENLKYYFNKKVCLSIHSCVHSSVHSCVRRLAPIPACESQDVTNKSCSIYLRGDKNALRDWPLGFLALSNLECIRAADAF